MCGVVYVFAVANCCFRPRLRLKCEGASFKQVSGDLGVSETEQFIEICTCVPVPMPGPDSFALPVLGNFLLSIPL